MSIERDLNFNNGGEEEKGRKGMRGARRRDQSQVTNDARMAPDEGSTCVQKKDEQEFTSR
jgi:hypothetical protein